MILQDRSWFVRSGNRIQGPFAPATIRSMKDRGKLLPESELSIDRSEWINATLFDELFVDYETQVEEPVSGQANEPAAQFFYAKNGEQCGPVSFARLQELTNRGELSPMELVWYEGANDWMPAGALTELKFQSKVETTKLFAKRNIALVSLAAFALFLTVGVPTWYALSVNHLQNAAREQAIANEKEDAERKERNDKDDADRRERREKEDADRQNNIDVARIKAEAKSAGSPERVPSGNDERIQVGVVDQTRCGKCDGTTQIKRYGFGSDYYEDCNQCGGTGTLFIVQDSSGKKHFDVPSDMIETVSQW